MAVETAKDKIKVNQIVSQKQEIITVDGDVIVNDVKPDVLRVISTTGTLCIYKKEALNGKIKLELKDNIKTMRDEGYEYKSYSLPEASQVQKFTKDGKEMAWMDVTITIETNDEIAYRYVRYILINENNKWKIYGWGDPKQ